MGARRITKAQQDHYFALRAQGYSIANAAKEAGFSKDSGKRLERLPSNGRERQEIRRAKTVPDLAVPLGEVCEGAKEALADRTGFLFCKRYMGVELSPWQQMKWEALEDAWDTPDREFVCVNAAPGLGKSTVGVGFAAKRIVLDRAVRTLFISRARSLAERNTMRLRRLLERTSPAVGADATLSGDFGRFKPLHGGDVWKRDEFVVEQMDGTPIEEKEPTCSAFGFDSEWIGNRIDFVFGDDLDTTSSIRNIDIVTKNREIFDNELEARLEPGGLFCIAQQRLGSFDFSNHALSKVVLPDDDGSDSDEDPEGVRQYRHVIFRAHYEDRCGGKEFHRHDAPPWPDGCLLDPRRLSWRDVRKAMNNSERFNVVYQQQDPGETGALVQRIWVDGGRGPDGIDYPGCWDYDRGACELPEGLAGDVFSIATADPSPTKFWSVQWWAYHPDTEQRFLLDLVRQSMDAPEFLDWDHNNQCFSGLMEEWQQRSIDLGIPITSWVVEANAAQRFMLQYQHVHRWQRLRSVDIIPHQTHRNKSDVEFGVQTIAPHYRYGRVRLPGRQNNPGRIAALKLVDEVTRWPEASTDDCVMGHWFFEWQLPNIAPKRGPEVKLWRPTWIRSA